MNKVFLQLLTVSFFCLTVTTLNGQANKKESYSINFGPELAFPETNFKSTHVAGIGGSVKAEYTFGKHGSVTLNSGILIFEGKDYTLPTSPINAFTHKSLTAIPVKAGVRYYLGNFYAAGEAGIIFLTNYLHETRPALSIGLGDKIKIGKNKIDISLRQEFWLKKQTNLNTATLRVAYEIVW